MSNPSGASEPPQYANAAAPPYPSATSQAPYPPQGPYDPYPPQSTQGPSATYPTQNPYPPQGPSPPAAYPPQTAYPPPTAYPPQGAYAPYPPQDPNISDKTGNANLPPPPAYTPGNYGTTQQIGVFVPNQGIGTSQIIVTQPTAQTVLVARGPTVGPHPALLDCNNCRERVSTRVEFENGALTWIFFGFCCLFGCWLGCCLIPFCMKGTKNAKHYCPRCNTMIGYYSRM